MTSLDDKEFWLNTEKMLQKLLKRFSRRLDGKTVDSVQHYLDHSEYEMAFEGLFIDLMDLGVELHDVECHAYVELGKSLSLDEDSVLDAEFWTKFVRFIAKNTNL